MLKCTSQVLLLLFFTFNFSHASGPSSEGLKLEDKSNPSYYHQCVHLDSDEFPDNKHKTKVETEKTVHKTMCSKPKSAEGHVQGGNWKKADGDMSQWPCSVHGHIHAEFEYKDGDPFSVSGSAFMISLYDIGTAAHNLYRPNKELTRDGKRKVYHLKIDKWAKKVVFIAAYNPDLKNGLSTPFGIIEGKILFSKSEWITKLHDDHDIGVVRLNEPVGDQTGWYGLYCDQDKDFQGHDIDVCLRGYPIIAERLEGMRMGINKIKTKEVHQITYQIHTSSGQSGSAVYMTLDEQEYLVVAVHTGNERIPGHGNIGVRLSKENFNFLVQCTNFEHAEELSCNRDGNVKDRDLKDKSSNISVSNKKEKKLSPSEMFYLAEVHWNSGEKKGPYRATKLYNKVLRVENIKGLDIELWKKASERLGDYHYKQSEYDIAIQIL